jgi:hypothetical protein
MLFTNFLCLYRPPTHQTTPRPQTHHHRPPPSNKGCEACRTTTGERNTKGETLRGGRPARCAHCASLAAHPLTQPSDTPCVTNATPPPPTATHSPNGSRPTRTPPPPTQKDETPYHAARDANPRQNNHHTTPHPPDSSRPTDATTTKTDRRRPRLEQAPATISPIPRHNNQRARTPATTTQQTPPTWPMATHTTPNTYPDNPRSRCTCHGSHPSMQLPSLAAAPPNGPPDDPQAAPASHALSWQVAPMLALLYIIIALVYLLI